MMNNIMWKNGSDQAEDDNSCLMFTGQISSESPSIRRFAMMVLAASVG